MLIGIILLLMLGGSFLIFVYVVSTILGKNKPINEEDINNVSFPKHLTWSILLAIVGYNFFMYDLFHISDSVFGIGSGLFHLFIIIGLLLSFPKEKRNYFTYFIALFGVLSAFASFFRASELVQDFNFLMTRFSCLTLAFTYILTDVRWEGLWIIKNIWGIVFNAFRHLLVMLKLTFQTKDSKKSHILKIGKTIFITLVIFLIFVSLLSQADPVFGNIISDLTDQLAERTILSIGISAVIVFLLSYKITTDTTHSPKLKIFGFYDLAVPVSVLTLLFCSFLFIQWKYLFASNADFQSFGITYSDYVRKGFIELLVTSFFGSIISYFVVLKARETESIGRMRFLKIINVVLIVELFALLASAMKRDLLYLDIYGLTRVRLAGGILLICLALFFILILMLNLFRKTQEKHLFLGTVSILVLAFITMNSLNIDNIIATTTPPEGVAPDYFYINNLSSDAIEGWESSIYNAKTVLDSLIVKTELTEEEKTTLVNTKLSLLLLKEQKETIDNKFCTEEDFNAYLDQEKSGYDGMFWFDSRELEAERAWMSFNLSEYHAYKIMDEKSYLFDETVDCLLEEVADYQITNLLDLYYDYEYERINEFEYPLVTVRIKDASEYSLSSLISDAVYNADPDLKSRIEEAYSSKYDYVSSFSNDQLGLFDELKAYYVPTQCVINNQ